MLLVTRTLSVYQLNSYPLMGSVALHSLSLFFTHSSYKLCSSTADCSTKASEVSRFTMSSWCYCSSSCHTNIYPFNHIIPQTRHIADDSFISVLEYKTIKVLW